MQNVLIIRTQSSGFNSPFAAVAKEWRLANGDGFETLKYAYGTPLQALQDGWKLLAPPTQIKKPDRLEWWFIKD